MCFLNKQSIAIYILNLRLLLISSGFWQCLWRRWWPHRALHQALWILRLHIPVEGVGFTMFPHLFLEGRETTGLNWKYQVTMMAVQASQVFLDLCFYMMSFTQSQEPNRIWKPTFTCMTSRDENDKNKHTVDGRNPAPPGMYKTLVNNGINYLWINWWTPDFGTIYQGQEVARNFDFNDLDSLHLWASTIPDKAIVLMALATWPTMDGWMDGWMMDDGWPFCVCFFYLKICLRMCFLGTWFFFYVVFGCWYIKMMVFILWLREMISIRCVCFYFATCRHHNSEVHNCMVSNAFPTIHQSGGREQTVTLVFLILYKVFERSGRWILDGTNRQFSTFILNVFEHVSCFSAKWRRRWVLKATSHRCCGL